MPTLSPEQMLLAVWRKFASMRPRPALYVGESRPWVVELYIDATYETLELAYGPELLQKVGWFRSWAGPALARRCGTSLGSHSAGSYLEQHNPDLDLAVDVLFQLHEEYISEILGLEVEAVWLPQTVPDPALSDPLKSGRLYLDCLGNQVWGRLYSRPLDPQVPLHAAILERSAEVRASLPDYPLPLPVYTFTPSPRQEPLRYSCFSAEDVEQIRALGDRCRLAAAAFNTQFPLGLLQEARQGSDAEIVLAALACQCVTRLNTRDELIELWGLLDLLARRNPASGAPHLLRSRLYLHIGLMEEAWRSLRRAARSPVWETWDIDIRRLGVSTAEAIGWPSLEARRWVLGCGPFSRASLMLLWDLKKLRWPPRSAIRAVHQIALREHRKGLAVERMVAGGLERWARSLLPALCTTPDQGTGYMDEVGPALEWLRQLDAETINRERWVAYYDQLYGESELAALRTLQAELKKGLHPSNNLDIR